MASYLGGNDTVRKPVTLATLAKRKADGEKFTVLTTYDASFAALLSRCGVDVILVGDSLGMVLQGHDSTLPVSIDDMCYHVACVQRGNESTLVMADLPFMGTASIEQCLAWSGRLMAAGAHLVKIEGGGWLSDTVRALKRCGIPVCAHLGLTPQSVLRLGGFRVQGREEAAQKKMIEQAHAVVAAGAEALVLECVPASLAAEITRAIDIPTIGIGAGVDCDGQILVSYDLLGITPGKRARFTKDFLIETGNVSAAIERYAADVRARRFPTPEHSF